MRFDRPKAWYVVIKDRKWSVFEADPIGGKGKPLSKKGYDDMPCRDFEASSDELTVLLHPRDGGKDFKFRVGAGEGASVASEWVRAFRLNGATAPGAPAPEPEPEPEPAATEEPAAAAAAAATATEEPAAVTEEPVAAAATEEPAAATEEPAAATATEEPAMDAATEVSAADAAEATG
ncbi:unnamed protein product [Symbiodinium sp. KB8]|nr:unnamed protein product [Symbiodinium sp. KB8]